MNISRIALSVIEDIEFYGHYQDVDGRFVGATGIDGWYGECCVVANPTMDHASLSECEEFEDAFVLASGVEDLTVSAPTVNDALTTDEVLDILWAIALG